MNELNDNSNDNSNDNTGSSETKMDTVVTSSGVDGSRSNNDNTMLFSRIDSEVISQQLLVFIN